MPKKTNSFVKFINFCRATKEKDKKHSSFYLRSEEKMKKQPIPEKLNICMVADRFPILSRQADHSFIWPIAKGLCRLGHEVTILAGSGNVGQKELVRDGVRVFYLTEKVQFVSPAHQSLQDQLYELFLRVHRQSPVHLVHALDASAIRIAENRRDFNIAVIYDSNATSLSKMVSIAGRAEETLTSFLGTAYKLASRFLKLYFTKDRPLLQTADGMFVTSPQQQILLERYYLYPFDRTFIVPYGIELSEVNLEESGAGIREKLGISDQAQVAVTLSDMVEANEVVNIIRAFEKVAIKKPNSFLIVVGNGPKFKDIEYCMLNLALGKRVFLVGSIKETELPYYIQTSNVFINLSSRTTGFEPSLLEAMAQKKAVIGSEVSPISTIIEDGLDGFLIRPADTESLASLLIAIFDQHIPLDKISQNAQKKITHIFDTQQMLATTLAAYKKTLKVGKVFS